LMYYFGGTVKSVLALLSRVVVPTPTMVISEMPTGESVYAQISYRVLRKTGCSDLEYLVFGRYKNVYIPPFG
jgi:hypothetical protein